MEDNTGMFDPVQAWGRTISESGLEVRSYTTNTENPMEGLNYVWLWQHFLEFVTVWEDFGWIPTFNFSFTDFDRTSDTWAYTFVLTREYYGAEGAGVGR